MLLLFAETWWMVAAKRIFDSWMTIAGHGVTFESR